MTAPFDLTETDRLLSTTRAVRKRLDLDRPVEREVLLDCVRLSQQAPTPANAQSWRWVIVTDATARAELARIYRIDALPYLEARASGRPGDDASRRVHESASWLAHHLEQVPVHVIPCLERGTSDEAARPPDFLAGAGIFPAVWSFQLALRARGLGSTLTTLHLRNSAAAAELLGIPDHVLQVALLPVAYTTGTEFSSAERPPAESIVHFDRW